MCCSHLHKWLFIYQHDRFIQKIDLYPFRFYDYAEDLLFLYLGDHVIGQVCILHPMQAISDAAYDTDCTAFSLRDRKNIQLIIRQAQKGKIFKGSAFFTFSLPTSKVVCYIIPFIHYCRLSTNIFLT